MKVFGGRAILDYVGSLVNPRSSPSLLIDGIRLPKDPPEGCILFAENEPLDFVVRQLRNSKALGFVQGNHAMVNSLAQVYFDVAAHRLDFCLNPLRWLDPNQNGNSYTQTFVAGQTAKSSLTDWLDQCLSQSSTNQAGRQAAVAVFEELFMNAKRGDPDSALQSKEQKQNLVDFLFLDLGPDIVLSCLDHWGGLDVTSLLARMSTVLENGMGESIRFDSEGGAGIGCTLMLQYTRVLSFVSVPGEATRVTAVIPKNARNKDWEQLQKSLLLMGGEKHGTGKL